jgi:hypothetical protein
VIANIRTMQDRKGWDDATLVEVLDCYLDESGQGADFLAWAEQIANRPHRSGNQDARHQHPGPGWYMAPERDVCCECHGEIKPGERIYRNGRGLVFCDFDACGGLASKEG